MTDAEIKLYQGYLGKDVVVFYRGLEDREVLVGRLEVGPKVTGCSGHFLKIGPVMVLPENVLEILEWHVPGEKVVEDFQRQDVELLYRATDEIVRRLVGSYYVNKEYVLQFRTRGDPNAVLQIPMREVLLVRDYHGEGETELDRLAGKEVLIEYVVGGNRKAITGTLRYDREKKILHVKGTALLPGCVKAIEEKQNINKNLLESLRGKEVEASFLSSAGNLFKLVGKLYFVENEGLVQVGSTKIWIEKIVKMVLVGEERLKETLNKSGGEKPYWISVEDGQPEPGLEVLTDGEMGLVVASRGTHCINRGTTEVWLDRKHAVVPGVEYYHLIEEPPKDEYSRRKGRAALLQERLKKVGYEAIVQASPVNKGPAYHVQLGVATDDELDSLVIRLIRDFPH